MRSPEHPAELAEPVEPAGATSAHRAVRRRPARPDPAGLSVVARIAWHDYLALYPPAVLVGSTVPRAVLQPLFLAYLGFLMGGAEGRAFAITGGCVHVLALATVVRAADMLTEEQPAGTLHRLRLSRPGLALVHLTRCWVYVVEALVSALVAVVGVCAFFGEWQLMGSLLSGAPVLAVTAVSVAAFGLGVAAVTALHPAAIVLSNLVVYALLVLTGIVAPVEALPAPLEQLAQLLPLTHGAASLRALAAGDPWAAQAAAEAAVGVFWLCTGLWLLRRNDSRARRLALDDRG
ncbi:ABC transporter permease [Streptomyces sp. ISL-10]|uniref:ABC transporter permease n=1 Tax=Streptomyces sp. ISL-10 TaxID=2819172 RepID=UPI001BE976CB|nr:ABC transporter permease [Streptomyces sp. ISL-10]MBT2365569.1 ABC transporter permease [Streptomyces sp. ISL-10]